MAENVKPLDEGTLKRLKTLSQKKNFAQIIKGWGVARQTIAEACAGWPKRESTRVLIELRLTEAGV